jgi:hypothetical protein
MVVGMSWQENLGRRLSRALVRAPVEGNSLCDFYFRRPPDLSWALTNQYSAREHHLESEEDPLLRPLRRRLRQAEHGQVFRFALCAGRPPMEESAFGP